VLALEAANKLDGKVKGLFMHEPPFIVDDSHPPMPADMTEQINTLLAANRRSEAVKRIFRKGMGLPAPFVTMMRLMPGWKDMVEIAHTIPYDLAVLEGTQTGKSLPTDRWASLQAPTLVMVGSKSEQFFHTGAKAVVDLLPGAEYRVLEGGDHGAPMMAPKNLAAEVLAFFAS
jgi:pimeloyl-ACP methyl ester carboxylesterase